MLTDEEAAFWHDFIRTSEIQKIRHALYGALLFLPLYLLTHRKLTGNAWDQEKMLKACPEIASLNISHVTLIQSHCSSLRHLETVSLLS